MFHLSLNIIYHNLLSEMYEKKIDKTLRNFMQRFKRSFFLEFKVLSSLKYILRYVIIFRYFREIQPQVNSSVKNLLNSTEFMESMNHFQKIFEIKVEI
jgi:hypothetical protein